MSWMSMFFITYSKLNHKAYWHLKTKIEGIRNLVGQTGRHDDANKVQSREVTAHMKDRGECRKGSTGLSSDHPCSYSKGYISEEKHLKLAGKH